MTHTKITHTSYTEKNGYVFRKRTKGGVLSISLQTRDPMEATHRASAMTIRFLNLESNYVEYVGMKAALMVYRDELVRTRKLAHLTAIMNASAAPQAINANEPMQPLTIEAISAQMAVQELTQETEGTLLEQAKSFYLQDKARDWGSVKTGKNVESALNLFFSFCATQGIATVEEITKPIIANYKLFLDNKYPAPSTRKQRLVDLSSFFAYCMNQREWIERNPVAGMQYKKAEVVNKKIPVSREEYELVMSGHDVQHSEETKHIISLFYHTGVRMNELVQLGKNDYREIDGVKCISINREDGKTTKNLSSIRNIPLNDTLLEMGIWEKKPVFRLSIKQIEKRLQNQFDVLKIKRTSHCFRYSLINRLADLEGVEDSTRYAITGHSNENMSDSVYRTRLPLKKMKNALDRAAGEQVGRI